MVATDAGATLHCEVEEMLAEELLAYAAVAVYCCVRPAGTEAPAGG